jgi:hypothetical protein
LHPDWQSRGDHEANLGSHTIERRINLALALAHGPVHLNQIIVKANNSRVGWFSPIPETGIRHLTHA